MVKTRFYPSNLIQKLQEYKVFSPFWWCTAIQTGALFISFLLALNWLMISVIHKNNSYVWAGNIEITRKVTTYMFKAGCEFLPFSAYLLPFTKNIFLCLRNCIYKKMTEPSSGLFRPKRIPNYIYWWKLPTHFQASKSLSVFLDCFMIHNSHTRCFCATTLPGFGHLASWLGI